jgi:exopolysaccharide production protein ExoQ
MTYYAQTAQEYAARGVASQKRTDAQRSILRFLEYLFVVIVVIMCLNGWRMLLSSGNEDTVETLTEANRTFQLVSGTLYAIAAMYLLAHWSRFFRLCMRNWPLLLLVAIVIMSAVWSVYPVVTLRRAAALVLTTGFGAYLALRFPPDVALKLVAWACAVVAIASLVVAAVDPSIAIYQNGGEEVWRGIFGQKNAMGRAMAFALLTLVAATFVVRPAARLATIAAALLCGTLLFLSMSRGGWVTGAACLIGIPLFVLLQPNRFSPAVRIAMVGLAATIGAALIIAAYTYGLALIGRDENFSGRSRLWDVAIRAGMKHFVLGAGYRSFWTDAGAADVYVSTSTIGSSLGNGHNGYLDTWLEIGIVGLGAFVLVFVTAIWRVARRLTQGPDPTCIWLAMILAYTFVYAWSEQILIHQSEIAWVMLVATLFWLTPSRSKARGTAPLAPSVSEAWSAHRADRRPGAARGVAAATRHPLARFDR